MSSCLIFLSFRTQIPSRLWLWLCGSGPSLGLPRGERSLHLPRQKCLRRGPNLSHCQSVWWVLSPSTNLPLIFIPNHTTKNANFFTVFFSKWQIQMSANILRDTMYGYSYLVLCTIHFTVVVSLALFMWRLSLNISYYFPCTLCFFRFQLLFVLKHYFYFSIMTIRKSKEPHCMHLVVYATHITKHSHFVSVLPSYILPYLPFCFIPTPLFRLVHV